MMGYFKLRMGTGLCAFVQKHKGLSCKDVFEWDLETLSIIEQIPQVPSATVRYIVPGLQLPAPVLNHPFQLILPRTVGPG